MPPFNRAICTQSVETRGKKTTTTPLWPLRQIALTLKTMMILLTTAFGKARHCTVNFWELIDGLYFVLTALTSLRLVVIPSLLRFVPESFTLPCIMLGSFGTPQLMGQYPMEEALFFPFYKRNLQIREKVKREHPTKFSLTWRPVHCQLCLALLAVHLSEFLSQEYCRLRTVLK